MSLAYRVDELLALRDSVSESAISIEKFPDEDVIREHVLRPSASASANLASRSSNRSLRVPATVSLAGFGTQKKPSPTPSIKRGKAERLLKEHGSPPGLRVTAGGRIVPSDLPPLGTSRYGDTTYRPQQALRVAPGNIMPAQAQANGNNTARIEVVDGQPVIFLGDRMFAVQSAMPSVGPTAMDPSFKQMSDTSALAPHGALTGGTFGLSRSNTHTPFAGVDLATLKTQQALKKQELRTVEQTEVLQASHQSEVWRAGMIEKKRCLIVELDALRKQITALEANNSTTQSNTFPGLIGSGGSTTMPAFGPQFQQPFAAPGYPFVPTSPYTAMPMYQPQPQSFGVFPSFPTAEPAPFVPPSTNTPQSPPGSASRRSRAIEIKPPPPEEAKKASALNPKSPTYEPATKSNILQGAMPHTASSQQRSNWQGQEISELGNREHRVSSQKHSLSSIDTMDFFPTNTHEHSSTRVAPQSNENKNSSNENTAVPCTPEKLWPASPWNEEHSGRSRKQEAAPKLTSWPEAFGKQPSLSSLRNSATGQPLSATLERAAPMTATTVTSLSSSSAAPRTNSDQRGGTDENWPFPGKAVTQVPCTYQEGYQAGYDHVGIPDSPEVLQGYIQGLLHFLTDETKKRQAEYQRGTDSRTPSLRGLVAGSLPHDSAVGMSFNNNNSSVKEGQENNRRIASEVQYLNPPVSFPPRMKDKSTASREEGLSNGGSSQPSFGIQIQNRTQNTPWNVQRFYPTPKEVGSSELSGYRGPRGRPFANHRLSGLDGAMDDLSEMINDTHIDDGHRSVAADKRSNEAAVVEHEESEASCFKSNKGKQKAASPSKAADMERDMTTTSSPAPSSPKKSGEQSPAKAKLEQVTSKFRRSKKDDPRNMSPDERKTRSDKWRQRFQQLKRTEMEEIEAHGANSRT
ncbi:fimbriae-associated fap1 [Pyrenophora seminiperda CCB06]|uniref:Fimbriae-associated fap1 n=1 Tax=Pyrenophora seminiperda CCB06 TaxID=1302712 RepID=A0A3M7M3N0_9PLEO|nr:fimbriae-associated fap1 [Pyrenophora seminiperda CCB06]